MGNTQSLNYEKETILWLDKYVKDNENKKTYEYYSKLLVTYNFICFSSIKDLFKFIKKNMNYFEFHLFYIVVSGSLAEEFYRKYVKFTEKYNIIAAITVYCLCQSYHETKPYFKDKFLNSGGITDEFEYVLSYIMKDECQWKYLTTNYKEYIPAEEAYGDAFMYIDTSKEYELALPILIGRLINSSLIENGEIEKFQNLLLSRYCKSYINLHLIKPSGKKNMKIPLHILIKFWIKLYTEEGPFYNDINRDLSNEKFDDYHPFIFLLYDSISKGFIKSYKKKKLSKKEFENMFSEEKIINNNQKAIYYSKKILSFSKSKKKALEFLHNIDDNQEMKNFL